MKKTNFIPIVFSFLFLIMFNYSHAETKWVQPPNMGPASCAACHVGDWESNHPEGPIVVDDFFCDNPNPIIGICWWGSYLDGEPVIPSDKLFKISVHYSDPTGGCLPDELVFWFVFTASEDYYGTTEDGEDVYYYCTDFDPLPPFDQWQGEPYTWWVDIAYANGDQRIWGWHESSTQWGCPAVKSLPPYNQGGPQEGPWYPLDMFGTDEPIDMAFELYIEFQPTMYPVETECPQAYTLCPETATECADVQTECPEVPTACPVDRTVCPADLPTVCPEEFTVCPEVYTMCPEFEPTYCQQIDTQCPDIPTECYAAETWCPWDYTWCPEDQTLCPEIHTMCPDSMPTICKFTLCPEEFTWCPADETWCPEGPTFCPFFDTMCGPPTMCEMWTICPDEATFCPTRWTFCPEYPTECPVIETECPTSPTWCPDPGDFTTCAITEPTWCPEVITECPQLDTFCPDGMPGLCDITVFPMIDTVCPLDPGICPPVPDLCQDYWDKYDCCVDMVAAGREIDYNVCKGYTDQTTCEANGCTWHPDGNPLGNCILDVCLTEVSGDDKVTAPDYSVFKKEFGRAGCPCVPAPGDDLCDKYTCLYDYCIALNSLGRETDYDVCKTFTDQTTCEANGCTWHPDGNPLGNCMLDICLTEVSGDDKVTAPDYSVFKKEFGRAGCPCAMP